MTTFRFTAETDAAQEAAFRRHMGARRFAFNQGMAAVKDGLDAKRREPNTPVPWTGFDLINHFNRWKRSEAAGRRFAVDANGTAELVEVGLLWRHEVCAQVFEEAVVDLGRALGAFAAAKGTRRRVGFPGFAKKGRSTESFRIRNRVSSTGRHSIRVGEARPRSITLPVIGVVQVREDTRCLRRLLGSDRGRICSVTVRAHRARFKVIVTLEAAELHPGMVHAPSDHGFVGVDRGLSSYLVAASADGTEVARVEGLGALERSLAMLRRADRRQSRTQPHGRTGGKPMPRSP